MVRQAMKCWNCGSENILTREDLLALHPNTYFARGDYGCEDCGAAGSRAQMGGEDPAPERRQS